MNNNIKGLLEKLDLARANSGLSGNTQFVNALSVESVDGGHFASMVDTLDVNISNAFANYEKEQDSLSTESIDCILDVRYSENRSLEAAKMIAPYAANPEESFDILSNLKKNISNDSVVSVEANLLGGRDTNNLVVLSNEAFDPKGLNNSLKLSTAVSYFGAALQDEFNEGFFGTRLVSPTTSGLEIKTTVTSVMKEATHNTDGTVSNGGFEKKPIVMTVFDKNTWGSDKNRLIPVYREEKNKALFLDTEKYVLDGVTTAPLKITNNSCDIESLIGLSQTDAVLSKGAMDFTDAIDTSIVLRSIYFSVTNVLNETDNFLINVKGLSGSSFIPVITGNTTTASLSFKSNIFNISTKTIKNTKEETPESLSDLVKENYDITISIGLYGTLSCQTGALSVTSKTLTVHSVKKDNEILTKDSAEYKEVVSHFVRAKVEGFVIDTYRTNSNLRNNDQLITADEYGIYIPINMRSGVYIPSSAVKNFGSEGDIVKIKSIVSGLGIKLNIYGVEALLDYIETLKMYRKVDKYSAVGVLGIGSYHVNPYYRHVQLSLTDYVDSTKSAERLDDVQAALVNRIRDEVINMTIESNYEVALKNAKGAKAKMTVIIGTDTRTKFYLTQGNNTLKLSEEIDAVVVGTQNPAMNNKIIVSFITADRNGQVVDEFNFGQCIIRPTITADIQKTIGNAVINETRHIPSFTHSANLPVLTEIDITDNAGILGKNVYKVKNI